MSLTWPGDVYFSDLTGRGAFATRADPGFFEAVRPGARGEVEWGADIQAEVVRVQSVAVGEARVSPLPVVAHDIDLGRVHGLLGRDFLAFFTVTIDSRRGVLTLTRE